MDKHIDFARRATSLMDSQYKIGTFSFGIDALLNIVPGLGSLVGALISVYIFWVAIGIKLPTKLYMKMVWNVAWDFIIGEVPVLGVYFDALFKANVRNMRLIDEYLEGQK